MIVSTTRLCARTYTPSAAPIRRELADTNPTTKLPKSDDQVTFNSVSPSTDDATAATATGNNRPASIPDIAADPFPWTQTRACTSVRRARSYGWDTLQGQAARSDRLAWSHAKNWVSLSDD